MLKKILFLSVFSIITFISCKKSNIDEPKNDMPILNEDTKQIQSETKERFELITLLVADVFNENPELLTKFKRQINKDNLQNGREALYFKQILDNNDDMDNEFAEKFISEITLKFNSENFTGKERVTAIMAKIKKKIQASQNNLSRNLLDLNSITTQELLLPHLGSEMYLPFSDMPIIAANQNPYYCYDPLNLNATTVEVFKEVNGVIQSQIVTGDDSWAMENATIVIKFDDEVAGNQLDRYEQSICAARDFFNVLCPPETINFPRTQGVDSFPPPPPPPPPVPTYCGPLNNNIAPSALNTIDDRYLINATIPKVRLLGNLRWAFWSGKNDIAFYRGNTRIALPNRPAFSEAVIDTSFQVFTKSITRRQGKFHHWVDIGASFNNDWKLQQHENYVALTVVKHWLHFQGANLSFSAKAGVVYDTATNRWIPSFNGSADVNGSINIRVREELEGEQKIARTSVFSNAIGSNFGGGALWGTCTFPLDCERNWSIRQIDSKMQFYFRVNICY